MLPLRPFLTARVTRSCCASALDPLFRCSGVLRTTHGSTDLRVSAEGAKTTTEDFPAFKVNIDWKSIKDNLDGVKLNVANRNSHADPDRIVELYDEWRDVQSQAEQLRSDRNENAKALRGKVEHVRREALIKDGKAIKVKVADLEERLHMLEGKLQREGQKLPNSSHPEVPVGSEANARTLREFGAPRDLTFEPQDHLALGAALDLMDFEAAAHASGTKFVYLRRAAALLEMALCSWAMQRAVEHGYLPLTTPDLVRASVLEKCGFQPRAENTQVYSVENSGLCLTGTAEVPLGAVYMDKLLLEAELPIRMAGFGHCFRTEAGAAGSASRGLFRVHQFSKVELFIICTPQQSETLLDELCRIEEGMFNDLGLHFKVLDMPTGDLGAPAYRKIDIEAWMPGLRRFGEISSASNCTDYQSRRLNIRYRQSGSKAASSDSLKKQPTSKTSSKLPTAFVHTLNATACAVPRLVIAILENFQTEHGTVVIPQVLQPYMGGMQAGDSHLRGTDVPHPNLKAS